MKTQAIPKFVTQLDGREVVIPAVLFHFDNPHAVAKKLKTLPLNSSTCGMLCYAYEEATKDYKHSIEKTYTQVGRALALWDFTAGMLNGDWYLEDYIHYRYGFEVRDSDDRHVVMPKLRREWQKHIVKHLLASEG